MSTGCGGMDDLNIRIIGESMLQYIIVMQWGYID
jgi:hypothetical protein